MSEIPALPDEPLAPGHFGSDDQTIGVTIRQIDVALATLVAGRGADSRLSETILAGFGVTLPQGPRCVSAQGISAVGIGPGRWTIVAEHLDAQTLLDRLQKYAGAFGSACDQSDGSVVYEISGPRVRDALAKVLLIDIDAVSFSVGSAATTQAALIGATFWQTDLTPTFRFVVARSYALAFVRSFAAGASEFGLALS